MDNHSGKINFDLKERAEGSINAAKNIILASIPENEIVTICVKGSYAQDALQEKSDVDLVLILKNNSSFQKAYSLSDQGKEFVPPFSISVYTQEELKSGKVIENRSRAPWSISRFNKNISDMPIIYGQIPEGEFFMRTDERDLSIDISTVKEKVVPEYRLGKLSFYELLKWVTRLTESEQRLKGFRSYLWKRNALNTNDPGHIIHEALRLRVLSDVSEEDKKSFLIRFEEYITLLEQDIKNE
ncbi:MAG: hypothetical protein JWP09_386 [Candidatus Taylorbacteria bacterium]|nr:hypothetical protein [Candidatus Taylorbacteria bacterium]